MNRSDRDFENFLRDFRPRQPRALSEYPAEKSWQWRRLAAAAIVAITCGGAAWFAASRYKPSSTTEMRRAISEASRASLPVQVFSRAELQRLALEDPAKFDAALFATAPNTLPRFTEPNSLLSILAKD